MWKPVISTIKRTIPTLVGDALREHAVKAALLAVIAAGGIVVVASASPRNEVAHVGDGSIARSDFHHWLRISDSLTRDKPKCRQLPREGTKRYVCLHDQVMEFLISAHWTFGEAAQRHVKASAREVRIERDETKNLAFGSERQYRRYLRNSCQAQADINYRTRIKILLRRIRQQVAAGKMGAERQRALDQFLSDFRAKWRALTVCSEGFIVEDCSNSSTPPHNSRALGPGR